MVGYAFATMQPRVLASRTLVANASSGQQRPVLRRRDGSSIEMPEVRRSHFCFKVSEDLPGEVIPSQPLWLLG